MELRTLRQLQVVARCGTITSAAAELGIAQPALSQTIAKIENELNVRLFNRSRAGVHLTPAGREYLEVTAQGIALIDAAAEQAQERASGKAGMLTVGFVSAAQYRVLSNALRVLRERFPRVDTTLLEMKNFELPDGLRANKVDVAFVHSPLEVGVRLHQKLVADEGLVAAVPSDFPERVDRRITLSQVASHGLITFPETDLPDFRSALNQAFQRQGLRLHIVKEVSRTLTALSCVAAGYGIALLSRATMAASFNGVKFLDIENSEELPHAQISVLWRADARVTIANRFVELL